MDTGILATHPDFEGRVVLAHSQINDGHGAGNPQACNGHGTHVAGLVGGATHGVAKRARIHSVRVFDCGGFGTADKFVSAMDWIKANHRMCSGVCTDLSKSFANCGTCGVTCSGTGIKCFDGEGGWTYAGMQCSAGKCVSRSCSE